jgi:D-alanine-D-alanine ligase
MPKLRVGLVYGGRSVEHEVSIASATSILRNLDPSRYEVWLVAIGHDGGWRLGEPGTSLDGAMQRGAAVVLPPTPDANALAPVAGGTPVALDVVFPIVHGHGGEDGSLQGLFELAGLAYVGSGVAGSALQMDKEIAKRLLAAAGIPVTPWRSLTSHQLARDPKRVSIAIADELGLPLFVKPANSGSSVGIQKVTKVESLPRALAEASRYDTKLLVEKGLDAREIEVAVLGNARRRCRARSARAASGTTTRPSTWTRAPSCSFPRRSPRTRPNARAIWRSGPTRRSRAPGSAASTS